jgi:hypothetical protein
MSMEDSTMLGIKNNDSVASGIRKTSLPIGKVLIEHCYAKKHHANQMTMEFVKSDWSSC